LSFSKSGIVPPTRRYPSEGDLKFAAPAENKAVFWKTPAKFLVELLEQIVFWKTLPASEFQQKARGAVPAGLRAARVDAAANVALMSAALNDSIWMQFWHSR
jgi:hypothetical protein